MSDILLVRRMGSSQSLVANIGVELSAEEEDSCAVVFEAAEAAGGRF
jgi:hypothetical protein